MKDWKMFVEENQEYTISETDGYDFLNIKTDQEQQTVICDMKGDVLAVLQEEMQDGFIEGREWCKRCKYLYVYSSKPYNTGTTVTAGLVSAGKPLYHWARVSAEGALAGKPTEFKICMADAKIEEAATPTRDIFHNEVYKAKIRKDARFTVKDGRGRGAATVDFNEHDSEAWMVSIAATADPVLLVCVVLQLQQLVAKLRRNGKGNVEFVSTGSTESTRSTAAISDTA
jgi:hypothetical protein